MTDVGLCKKERELWALSRGGESVANATPSKKMGKKKGG